MPDYPRRKRLRLPEYDYSTAGTYFLTICTKDRQPFFARIEGFQEDGMPAQQLTAIGSQVDSCIREVPTHYPNISLDHYVIMPNHIHVLLSIREVPDGAPRSSRPTQRVPNIVSALKRLTNQAAGQELWQTGYMDHVIRDVQDYQNHWNYITNNPFRWAEDPYYL